MYKFPYITSINQVRLAIAGNDNFVEYDRGDYVIFNYTYNSNNTFPPVITKNDAILRECRGLIFSKDGKVISRRLHKFFNLGERQEVLPENVDFNQPHVILEKLDGSMITPLIVNNQVRWASKMGHNTDVAAQVEKFANPTDYLSQSIGVIENYSVEKFLECCTPIFEWCSRQQRIVIDYPQDRLVLIAVRENITGYYWSYEEMSFFKAIPIVKAFQVDGKITQQLLDIVKKQEGLEGVVIRFDSGHMLKVKGDWYVKIHRAKDMISDERKVVGLIIEQKIDDLKSILLKDDRSRIEQYENQLVFIINTLSNDIFCHICKMTKEHNRKSYALEVSRKDSPIVRHIVFALWDDNTLVNVKDGLHRAILSGCRTIKNFDSIKQQLFPTLSYYGETNEYS